MAVFDELDVFNGPCQTDSLVAYFDWHMDLGYLGDDLLPIRLEGTFRSAWSSSVWYIYRQQSKCEKLYWLFWKGYITRYKILEHKCNTTTERKWESNKERCIFFSASIFLINLCLISWDSWLSVVCPPNVCHKAHLSLLDVQSHLDSPKNVDGRG